MEETKIASPSSQSRLETVKASDPRSRCFKAIPFLLLALFILLGLLFFEKKLPVKPGFFTREEPVAPSESNNAHRGLSAFWNTPR